MHRGAVFDEDKMYRYQLSRRWASDQYPSDRIVFVMLNPSTANAFLDDPTTRHCIAFAKKWGFSSLVVVNLFAFRTPKPEMLKRAIDPVGFLNDNYIFRAVKTAKITIAAWGSHGNFQNRAHEVMRDILLHHTRNLLAFDTNQNNQPSHPLYQPACLELDDLIDYKLHWENITEE